MIELILSTLAEFGLIREDFKHHRKISKMEKADGKKRPFQRYFLQPSSIMVISVLAIGTISAFIFFSYQRTSIFPKKTKKEIVEITERMEKWKEKFGIYPTDLNELIGNNPMRQEWKTDSWNRPYQYSLTQSGIGFLIISAGSDGKFGTDDDIKSVK
ncbi:type II secretion system protein GspG [Flavobacteriaceae bacterium GSB9]|nr:type II secretion system protein GspG [Flavobacteriaceae bacterium GSB9]